MRRCAGSWPTTPTIKILFLRRSATWRGVMPRVLREKGRSMLPTTAGILGKKSRCRNEERIICSLRRFVCFGLPPTNSLYYTSATVAERRALQSEDERAEEFKVPEFNVQ